MEPTARRLLCVLRALCGYFFSFLTAEGAENAEQKVEDCRVLSLRSLRLLFLIIIDHAFGLLSHGTDSSAASLRPPRSLRLLFFFFNRRGRRERRAKS